MNDLTPEELREQLLAQIPDAPEVSQWPAQIGERIAARRRRATVVRATAAVAVLALAAGVMWRAVSVSTPATPTTEVVVGAPSTTISPSTAPASGIAVPGSAGPSSVSPSTAAETSDDPSHPPSSQIPPPESDSPGTPPTSSPSGPKPPTDPSSSCLMADSPGENRASLPTGAESVTWCTPHGGTYAAPTETLEGAQVATIVARYNALPKAAASACKPAPWATYWLEVWYPEGGVIRVDGDLSFCDRVGAKAGARALASALGKAFDAQRSGGHPEVQPIPSCGPGAWNGTMSLMAFGPRLLTRGFRCEGTAPVELPTDLVADLASGMTPVPADLVLEPQAAWIVTYTASGDPIPMWIVDGWVWAKHLTVSGDPRSVEYLGWEPSPAQLAVLLGS